MKNRYFIYVFLIFVLPFLLLSSVKATIVNEDSSYYDTYSSLITGKNYLFFENTYYYQYSSFSNYPGKFLLVMDPDVVAYSFSTNNSSWNSMIWLNTNDRTKLVVYHYENGSWVLSNDNSYHQDSYIVDNSTKSYNNDTFILHSYSSYNDNNIILYESNYDVYDIYKNQLKLSASSHEPISINLEVRLIDDLWASNNVWVNDDSRSYEYILDSGTTIGDIPTSDYLSDMDLSHYYVSGVVLDSDLNTRYSGDSITSLQSTSLTSDTIIYYFLRPKFFVNYSAGEMCDLNNVHSDNITFKFTNSYSNDDLSSFKYYLGKSISNYELEEIVPYYDSLGNYIYNFIQYYNTTFKLYVYDKNNNLVFGNFYTLNDSNLLTNINNYDTYVFPNKMTLSYISYIPNTGLIGLQSDLNRYTNIYFYDIDTDTRFIPTSFSSTTDNNNVTWYSYDLDSSNHNYILMLYYNFNPLSSRNNIAFYVPSGAYVSFKDFYISNNDLNGVEDHNSFNYKDSNGDIISTSPTDNISGNDDINNFSDSFSSHLKSFYQEFAFFGNFISTLFSYIPAKLTYTLFFMFGLIVVGLIIRIWL